jgi:hypothetical protein
MGEVAFGVTFFDDAVVDSVAQWGGVVARVNEINRVAARDKDIHEGGVTRPSRVVQWGVSVTRFCVRDREAKVEHETHRFMVGIGFPTVAGQKFEIQGRQVGNHAGILAADGFRVPTTAENAAHEQTSLRVAVLVKKIEQAVVAFEKRNLVRIGIEGKSPLQYRAAATLVPDGWKVGEAAGAVGNAGGILRDQFGGEIAVTEGGSQENIWSRSAIKKVPGNLRSLADAQLGGSGIVVLIPGVRVRAVIEEELGSSEIAGEMKGRTAIAALGMDQQRIGPQYVRQAIFEAESSGGMHAERSATFHQKAGDGGRNVIGVETVGPGLTNTFRKIRMIVNYGFDRGDRGVGLNSF